MSDPTNSSKVHLRDATLQKLMKAAVGYQASDLILKPQVKPKLRVRGALKDVDITPYDVLQFEEVISQFLTPAQHDLYRDQGYIDIAYDLDEDNRFRINIFRARGKSTIAARRISSEILSFEELNLPSILREISGRRQGLILLAGMTGSGKSTTIAAMLNYINQNRACHIVTIEDPIEYIFKDDKAIVNQREVGMDVVNFEHALRSVVRENPDIILIGEMRDNETLRSALHAAETGHLVFGTIHASSATQCFGRIYNLFPADEREMIRTMLSANLIAIIYQILLPTRLEDIHRVPAVQVLVNNAAAKKYIADGRELELDGVIEKAKDDGMQSLMTSLVVLVNRGYIEPIVAMDAAPNKDDLKMRLRGIRSGVTH